MLELLKYIPFVRLGVSSKNELAPQQQEAQAIIETSKNFPDSILWMLRLTGINRMNPFDPFALGFPGKDLLDVFIREQAAAAIMVEEHTSTEARQIVKGHFEKSIALYSPVPGCISPLRNMADIMVQAYPQIGKINAPDPGGARQDAVGMCNVYARKYQEAVRIQ